jgi:hypothetical protein
MTTTIAPASSSLTIYLLGIILLSELTHIETYIPSIVEEKLECVNHPKKGRFEPLFPLLSNNLGI